MIGSAAVPIASTAPRPVSQWPESNLTTVPGSIVNLTPSSMVTSLVTRMVPDHVSSSLMTPATSRASSSRFSNCSNRERRSFCRRLFAERFCWAESRGRAGSQIPPIVQHLVVLKMRVALILIPVGEADFDPQCSWVNRILYCPRFRWCLSCERKQ